MSGWLCNDHKAADSANQEKVGGPVLLRAAMDTPLSTKKRRNAFIASTRAVAIFLSAVLQTYAQPLCLRHL